VTGDLALARALHVLAVLHWIGGLSFVTLVVLAGREPPEAILARFLSAERRFAPQARIAVLLAGASGLWLVRGLDLWWRFAEPGFWWMHAMVGVWLLFALALFLAEPLFLHAWFERFSAREPARALALARRFHRLLLAASLLTVVGAVAAVHG
jgi:putative copper export protein